MSYAEALETRRDRELATARAAIGLKWEVRPFYRRREKRTYTITRARVLTWAPADRLQCETKEGATLILSGASIRRAIGWNYKRNCKSARDD